MPMTRPSLGWAVVMAVVAAAAVVSTPTTTMAQTMDPSTTSTMTGSGSGHGSFSTASSSSTAADAGSTTTTTTTAIGASTTPLVMTTTSTSSVATLSGYLASTLFVPGLSEDAFQAASPRFLSVVARITGVPSTAVSVAYVVSTTRTADSGAGDGDDDEGQGAVAGVEVRYIVGLPAGCGCEQTVTEAMVSERLLSSLRLSLQASGSVTVTALPEPSEGMETPPDDNGSSNRLMYAIIASAGALVLTIIGSVIACKCARRPSDRYTMQQQSGGSGGGGGDTNMSIFSGLNPTFDSSLSSSSRV
ncbi:hypothetical protein PTSG_05690 [Salpingoeca rosetta]|uniref:Membrane-associated protein n=1 Tax=Salpingoeca rosetta (strain ATCC 50818 / BSB-021) TaxID=946362 RepID=F2UAY1_SALR5|nr:uncharacterized protein PTSG_05690 [Salpingoeca rosetta]EGD73994.1 hypothetical protein PTSG_05690 [Salpingoeca rosetta]|eukprot:XP_004993557.1 hypothetical protein PTSG_05690 [Salpingoeca rosetta]